MVTEYDNVFMAFKDTITDPDLLLLSDQLQSETLLALMSKAIAKCNRVVAPVVDLTLRDDELMCFENYIPDEVIDIIIEWMSVFWLRPYLNNIENLRNSLSTKDFSFFSPANLLEKISNRYEQAQKQARSVTNEFSFRIADMKELKT